MAWVNARRLLYGLMLLSFGGPRARLYGLGDRDIRLASFVLVADREPRRPFCLLLSRDVGLDRLSMSSSIRLVLRPRSPGDRSLRLLLVCLSLW